MREGVGRADVYKLSHRVDEHVDTVQQILEKFNEGLEAEKAAREELDRSLKRMQYDATAVKGRVGHTEKKLKKLEDEVDDMEAPE